MFEVTWIDTGVTRYMTRRELYGFFGKDMATGLLRGEWPHIVAVEV